MKVKDLMSKKIIFCHSNSTIYDIAKIMKKYDIGFVPIVNNKKIIGVVTDRDIVVNNVYNHSEDIEIMMPDSIISINQDESLENATKIMKKYKVKRLLVTNDKKYVGIISLSDIVSYIDSNIFIDTFKSIYEIDKNEHDYDVEIDEFYL